MSRPTPPSGPKATPRPPGSAIPWGGVWRLGAGAHVGKYPGKWFGLGSPGKDDQEGLYTPLYYGGKASLARWLPSGWLVGVQLDGERNDLTDDGQGAFRSRSWEGLGGGLDANISASIQHEGRDMAENPREGGFAALRFQNSLPGSDFDWRDVQFDASQVSSRGNFTVVLRALHEEAWGRLPFWNTPNLGNTKALRGLPDRRLRGEAVQCLGTEFRWNGPKIWIFPTQPALFAELGRAGDHSGVWSADPNLAAGLGMRSPLAGGKAVLRADYAWSAVGSGLYVDFGQAF